MKLVKKTLHVTLYSLYSGTPKLWLGLQFFIKEESRTANFKILVRTLSIQSFSENNNFTSSVSNFGFDLVESP